MNRDDSKTSGPKSKLFNTKDKNMGDRLANVTMMKAARRLYRIPREIPILIPPRYNKFT